MSIEFNTEKTYFNLNLGTGYLQCKYNGISKDVKSVSGNLIKVSKETYQFEDEFIDKLTLHLVEDEQEYIISFGYISNIARSTLNMLASLPLNPSSLLMKIITYRKENFIKIVILNDNNKLSWKYAPSEIPDSGKDLFFEKILAEIQTKIKLFAEVEMLERSMSVQDVAPVEAKDDILPF